MKTTKKQYVQVVSGKNTEGQPVFSVLVKRSYKITHQKKAYRLNETQPMTQVNEYYKPNDPRYSTIKFESDLIPFKLKTDVVFIGNAYTPSNIPRNRLNVGIKVGSNKKVIQVIGNRHCIFRKGLSPLITEPEPFTIMPIRYENAYGGIDQLSIPDLYFAYPRNNMGKGFAIRNKESIINGLALPNLEDPNDLLNNERIIINDPIKWSDQPLPQGLGWFQPNWYPRAFFAGALPSFVNINKPLHEELIGLVPKNHIQLARQLKLPSYDLAFHTGASHGLSFPYLKGNEHISLAHLCKEQDIFTFQLPDEAPNIMLDIGLGQNTLETVLQTVCIRMEDKEIDLVWRGAHPYPSYEWLADMKKQIVEVK